MRGRTRRKNRAENGNGRGWGRRPPVCGGILYVNHRRRLKITTRQKYDAR